ncbi:hypothetical protein [Niallia oryzisoli]|uniref:hypothetical protein n=1 Tax=Niallia oryzisoli TaxID=1737571 RepID=UPI0037369D30
MPYLRQAVEKQRQHYIKSLVEMKVCEKNDQNVMGMTLTELKQIFLMYKGKLQNTESNLL